MCSDSESAGGSSESRSIDSPTASPGRQDAPAAPAALRGPRTHRRQPDEGAVGVLSLSTGDFKRRLPRTPSTGTMSSADDLDEREPPSPSDNGERTAVWMCESGLGSSCVGEGGAGGWGTFTVTECFYSLHSCTNGVHVGFGSGPQPVVPVSKLTSPSLRMCYFYFLLVIQGIRSLWC